MSAIAQIIIPAFFLCFSIAYVVSVWDQPYKATALPYVVIFFIILIGSNLLAREIFSLIRSKSEEKAGIQTIKMSMACNIHSVFRQSYRSVLTLTLMCIYAYTARWNFYIVSFLFLMAQCGITGGLTWRQLPVDIVIMSAFTISSYLFFGLVLQIPL